MQSITVYDEDAEKIETLSDDHSTTDAEIITALFTAIEDAGIDINDYI